MGGVFNACGFASRSISVSGRNHINSNLYAYGANNPIRYIDPDGRSVKSGLLKMGLAVSEICGGVALSGGSGGVASAAGVLLILDGGGRFMLGLTDLVASVAENSGKETSFKSEAIPSSVGGAIGAVIDKSNGECFTDTGCPGSAQRTGEKINAGVTFVAGSVDYFNTVKSNPSPKETLKNEISHVYDRVDTATTILTLEQEK